LEELLAGQLLQQSHESREAAIAQSHPLRLTRLASEAEAQLGAFGREVPITHCSEAERLVGLDVLINADPDEARLEQAHDGRQYFAAP
jgi:hypothetical protein